MLELQLVSRDMLESKYLLKDTQGHVLETLAESRDRVAKALAAVEREDDRPHWESQFRYALEQGAIPAGRIYSNAGSEEYKSNVSLINCVVSRNIEDSIEGIYQAVKESALSLARGCGIGYCFSSIRPKGAFIHGVGARTSGALSYMDSFNVMCNVIESAGGRRGAQMGTMHVWHPEILDYIRAKREDGRFRQFNLSVLITDEFMRAVDNDEMWELYFPIHRRDYAENSYVWDRDIRLIESFPFKDDNYVYIDDAVLVKIYDRIPAREIWETIMRSTYEFAEPGVIFIDKMNDGNPLNSIETIVATNPCVTGDTLILTDRGQFPIETLVGQTVNVWNGREFSATVPQVTGVNQPILKVSFSDGSTVSCTPYHRFPIWEGFGRDGFLNVKEARDLSIGDKLEKWDLPIIEGRIEEDAMLAYTRGFFCGDGSVESRRNRSSIWLYGEKKRLLVELLHERYNVCDGDRIFVSLTKEIEWDKTFVPPVEWSTKSKLAWLAGLLDSDGNVQNGSLCISSIDRDFLKRVKDLLLTLGTHSTLALAHKQTTKAMPGGTYFCQDCFRLTISSQNVMLLLLLGLATKRLNIPNYPDRNVTRYVCVTAIEEAGVADKVYCFNEPLRHRGMFNGVNLLNCSEQPLPPYGSCLLGSINLTQFIVDPFTASAHFDFDRYERVIEIFARMLDNVVEINGLALPEQRHEIETKRRHGMGYLGLGSTLNILGHRYGSPAAIEFCEAVTKRLSVINLRTGIELAEEKGRAPVFDSHPGLLERYTRHPFIQQLLKELPSHVEKDLLTYGCRFTHFGSIAPTGTISLALANNASNGIEPSFELEGARNIIVPGKKTKEQYPVYAYEALLWQSMFGDTPYPDTFVTANQLTPKEHVDMQAAGQKWIESSISKTANVPTDMSFEDFKDVYRYGYQQGLKGLATYRFNPDISSGVLVRQDDLENTRYEFTLEDGTSIQVKGNDTVEYEGEDHIAANLFDALKEGYYGKL